MDKRITTDTIMLPRELTSENGAKCLLIGEFKESITLDCPECADNTEPFEDCDICSGDGKYEQEITVSWTTIKDIYAMIVENYGH